MLAIEDLHLRRGAGADAYEVELPALRLRAGEVVAVVGDSGCGKSTLLEGVGLLLTPQRLGGYRLGDCAEVGQWALRGDDRALAGLRAQRLGFVLQSGGLLPYLSAFENLVLPRRLAGLALRDAHLDYAIEALNLGGLLHKMPAALSIGERQRVACVRAMAHGPQLLLADEPTSALDPDNARRLFGLFLELARRREMACLVVSHDRALVREFGLPELAARLSPGRSVFTLAGAAP